MESGEWQYQLNTRHWVLVSVCARVSAKHIQGSLPFTLLIFDFTNLQVVEYKNEQYIIVQSAPQ